MSYEPGSVICYSGANLFARFSFQMPRVPPGSYSIAVAVAEGTQASHVQLHWIHDALILSSTSSSVASGLVGLPMRAIELYTEEV